MKKIAILGATGSIGTQALDIIRNKNKEYTIAALTAGKNISLLSEQINEFQPQIVCVLDADTAKNMQNAHKSTEFVYGEKGLLEIARFDYDMLLNALVGMVGLRPTFEAIRTGKDIALANKETLVAGGSVIMDAVKKYKVKMLPVDSEHSAIFQCLQGNKDNEIKKIILTASGGPFRGYNKEGLKKVTKAQALNHPNWTMGKKITIDSATLMNKGLEVIEASRLFEVGPEKIEVLVHPQSIIHSMVEFKDSSILAQLGIPDMKIPIAYALSFPKRLETGILTPDFTKIANLTFEKTDIETFECLGFAYAALKEKDSFAVALNAANEVLVSLFLEEKIKFIDIQNNINTVLNLHNSVNITTIDEIIDIDNETRKKVKELWA